MNNAEYETWLAGAVSGYAADKVASGQWSKDESLELARREHAELLPQGLASPGNHLFRLLTDSRESVGDLWIAETTKFGLPIAYVYSVEIAEQHRRKGYAHQAFQALEQEIRTMGLHGIALHVFGHNQAARALYSKLGYEPTNINLFKHVPTDA
jgi:ribosomal protein S18 acetylase RimI-like enzyme